MQPLYEISAFNRLESVRAKFKRAKKHINDLEIECTAFFESGPYLIVRQPHPQMSGWIVYGLTATRPIPHAISLMAGDALANLRSVLDYMAWELVGVNGSTPTRDTSFPIIDTEDSSKYEAVRGRKVQGMSDAAIKAIDALHPYKGGNNLLWRLDKLNNIHKHRVLVTVGAMMEGVSNSKAHFISPFNKAWSVLKSGDMLTTVPAELDVDEYMQFDFQVAFDEPGIAECQPVLEVLNETADFISHLISRQLKPLFGTY
jgi:hypothetical protein